MKKIWLLLFLTIALCAVAYPQSSNKGSNIFKIPDGVIPTDWSKNGFKGVLMLCKESPSGIFVGYPNEGETIEAMRERATQFITPMFIHDKKEQVEATFKKTSIPKHDGDFGESGLYYLFENEQVAVQILFYEREGAVKNLLYGYFATKDKSGKYKYPSIWADETGRGIKVFDKFWKSFK